jgi:phospholipid/cholesterol/gamma-HCH transport system ATP-binding protein
MPSTSEAGAKSALSVRGLTMAYGDVLVQRAVSFDVARGEIFVIMGGSGCGKSTLLKHLIGLHHPVAGEILYDGDTALEGLGDIARRFGVLFQGGALWSSMTVGENIALPLELFTRLGRKEIAAIVAFKLALVGLAGREDLYPASLSGGMRKRAGLARALALDPEILFLDEPSAGLDPISSRRLDDLILQIRDMLGTTIVMVTHELASIFAIADKAIFLDAETKVPAALGSPKAMLDESDNKTVQAFLRREA